MAITTIRGTQVLNGTIQRADLDVSTVGQAVVAKLIQGTNVTLSSTGGDAGTGDVTVSVPGGGIGPTGPPGLTGATGPAGSNGLPAYNITTAGFVVPNVGSTVLVTLQDTSWATVGEYVYVSGAAGSGQSGALQITAISGLQLTLLNPTPAPAIPPADNTQAGLLKQLSGNTTDFVDGTNTCQNLVTAIQPTIWSVRLRSFQALGNNTFEVDQRNVGNTITVLAAGNPLTIDRWSVQKVGFSTMTATSGQNAVAAGITLPGSGSPFTISRNFLRVNLTAQQASLAAGDVMWIGQVVEGIQFRALQNDVHSLQVLVRSSVASLAFGLALRDPGTTRSLVKLCTTSATPSTWTLIPLSNLPIWASGGNFASGSGVAAYQLAITLASGTTYLTPANDTWQNGNFMGAVGQSSFANSPVNSTFDCAYISHEPGSLCSNPPMDCPFTQNLDACQRYYTKSYVYGTAPGVASNIGALSGYVAPNSSVNIPISFKKVMAKVPTVTAYSSNTGAINTVYDTQATGNRAVSGSILTGDAGFSGFTLTTPNAVLAYYQFHYTADTGW
jgi:hypothetical protein